MHVTIETQESTSLVTTTKRHGSPSTAPFGFLLESLLYFFLNITTQSVTMPTSNVLNMIRSAHVTDVAILAAPF
jgi:hypothetical protein